MLRSSALLGVSIITILLVACVPASEVDEGEGGNEGKAGGGSGEESGGTADTAGTGGSTEPESASEGGDGTSGSAGAGHGGEAGQSAAAGTAGLSAGTAGLSAGTAGLSAGTAGLSAGTAGLSAGTAGLSAGATSTGGNDSTSTGGSGDAAGATGVAGASGGGSVGAIGGSDGSGGSTIASGDSCDGAEANPNEDRESATHYTLGTDYQACIQSADDVDFYEFTVPDDARGGYVTVSITDVGPSGDISLKVWSAADNGQFHSTYNSANGASVYSYFNAAPGATFRLEVKRYDSASGPYVYTINATYNEIADLYEPNDDRLGAAPISVGEEVEAFMFAGWMNSTGIPSDAWYDWYEIELEAGETSILLSLLASDVDGKITIYDSLGSAIDGAHDATNGSSVLLERTTEEAGTYYVLVCPDQVPPTHAGTNNVPQYLTKPYTLTVTQE